VSPGEIVGHDLKHSKLEITSLVKTGDLSPQNTVASW